MVTHLLDADVLASEHCAEIDFLSIEADAAAVVTVIALSWNGQSTSGKSARLAIFVIPILAKHALTLSKSADVSHPAAIVFPPIDLAMAFNSGIAAPANATSAAPP